ncbi:MAG: hypothetical protein ACK4YU_03735 [Paracoccus sp. (in: a-proteobacteria)]
MARIGTLFHGLAAATFVGAGAVTAFNAPPPVAPVLTLNLGSTVNLLSSPQMAISDGARLASAYLIPDNVLMWSLLLAVWLMVVLDAVGQCIDPSEVRNRPVRHPGIWTFYAAALLIAAGASWFLRDSPAGLAISLALATAAAIMASRRAAGRQRPAVGFFAGWLTAVMSAALAVAASNQFAMPLPAVAAIAILPAAAIGMAAQIWIGPSIGYSAAMIWAFCGLAVSTSGSDPLIALSAIVGIAGMAIVLVRAAS